MEYSYFVTSYNFFTFRGLNSFTCHKWPWAVVCPGLSSTVSDGQWLPPTLLPLAQKHIHTVVSNRLFLRDLKSLSIHCCWYSFTLQWSPGWQRYKLKHAGKMLQIKEVLPTVSATKFTNLSVVNKWTHCCRLHHAVVSKAPLKCEGCC